MDLDIIKPLGESNADATHQEEVADSQPSKEQQNSFDDTVETASSKDSEESTDLVINPSSSVDLSPHQLPLEQFLSSILINQDVATDSTPVKEELPNNLLEQSLPSILPEDVVTNAYPIDERLPNNVSVPEPQEENREEKPQTLSTQADLQPQKVIETPSEQTFNQLLQAQWQSAYQKETGNQSIAATNTQDFDNSLTLFERWQRLLLTQEVMESRQVIAKIQEQLNSLENQIHEPEELINLLLPLIAEILTLKVAEGREDVASAIAPVVDEMIQRRTQQDKEAMSAAIAPILPDAVTQQINNAPGNLARALAPEIGPAIKEQINLERDAMVDALYPVIGSTISKYMAEAIRSINEKVENALSFEGVSRKARAKMQGISEAELILKESIPFTVQAIFLIHKTSGLVISEVQALDKQHLESDMVAGMLTAIRSFVNDCIAQSGNVSEIDHIEYGDSQIILEVAGYCYLAVVTQGYVPKLFLRQMRDALVTIVQKFGQAMELFDGDSSTIPEPIHQIIQDLAKASQPLTKEQKPKFPLSLLLLSLVVLSTVSLALGVYQYRSAITRGIEKQTNLALESDPELAVYHLTVDANQKALTLSGRLPNQYLRDKAEQIAKSVAPNLKIKNTIIPVEVPPDPVLAQAEVKRLTRILNQMDGAVISANYQDGKVTVEGTVLQEADARKVTQAFQQIPGVKSVTNTVQLQPLAITSRVYFGRGSAELKAEERSKITQIRAFLQQYPNKHLKLLGHTDPEGTDTENQELALKRAQAVRDVLVAQGVDSERLHLEGTTEAPLGVDGEQVPLLSRCVEFRIIAP